jgi:hypothetical protein
MNKDTTDKVAWGIFFLMLLALVSLVGLFGWAVIELVQWITSK